MLNHTLRVSSLHHVASDHVFSDLVRVLLHHLRCSEPLQCQPMHWLSHVGTARWLRKHQKSTFCTCTPRYVLQKWLFPLTLGSVPTDGSPI